MSKENTNEALFDLMMKYSERTKRKNEEELSKIRLNSSREYLEKQLEHKNKMINNLTNQLQAYKDKEDKLRDYLNNEIYETDKAMLYFAGDETNLPAKEYIKHLNKCIEIIGKESE